MTGDPIRVRVESGPWLHGRIEMESDGKIMAVSVDEGVPAPFHLDPRTNRQLIYILWVGNRAQCAFTRRHVEITADPAARCGGASDGRGQPSV